MVCTQFRVWGFLWEFFPENVYIWCGELEIEINYDDWIDLLINYSRNLMIYTLAVGNCLQWLLWSQNISKEIKKFFYINRQFVNGNYPHNKYVVPNFFWNLIDDSCWLATIGCSKIAFILLLKNCLQKFPMATVTILIRPPTLWILCFTNFRFI